MSVDTASVVDPTVPPPVKASVMLPQTPPADLHVIDEFDAHSVAPAPVCPSRPRALYWLPPKPAPSTLTLPPPVLAWFVALALDSPLESNEDAPLVEPTPPTKLTASARLLPPPDPTLHTSDDSDTHSVACAPVMCSRAPAQCRIDPKPAPLMLMLPPPVPPRFTPRALDSDPTSYDAASLIDPPRAPPVTANAKLPHAPVATLHAAEVSDTHSVA